MNPPNQPPASSAVPTNPLDRFLEAQQSSFATALRELRAGSKRSHWMWYIFPQLAGLGTSSTARFYAIKDLAEAQAYLAHPTLGPRLIECAQALLTHNHKTAHQILGSPDDLKLRSSATLFAQISEPNSPFHQLLAKYYQNQPDERTLQLLNPTIQPDDARETAQRLITKTPPSSNA